MRYLSGITDVMAPKRAFFTCNHDCGFILATRECPSMLISCHIYVVRDTQTDTPYSSFPSCYFCLIGSGAHMAFFSCKYNTKHHSLCTATEEGFVGAEMSCLNKQVYDMMYTSEFLPIGRLALFGHYTTQEGESGTTCSTVQAV